MNRHSHVLLAFLVFASAATATQGETVEWIRQLGTASNEQSRGVSADGLGNVYVSGYTAGSLGGPKLGGTDAFLSRYDAAGSLLWTRQICTSGGEESYGVSADGRGNVYISGSTLVYLSNASHHDAFVSKYDASGSLLWTRQFGSGGDQISFGVAADRLGNVFITGRADGQVWSAFESNADVFLCKYDASGNLLWQHHSGTALNESGASVAPDSLGNVFVAGYTSSRFSTGSYNAFVSKYDGEGNLLWNRPFGAAGDDLALGASADNFGNIYVTGFAESGRVGEIYPDAFLNKFDAEGNLLWSRRLATTYADQSYGVSADGLGNVYISGFTNGSLGGPSAGSSDTFVSKYDSPGNLLWTHQLGTTGPDPAAAVSADGLGNVYFTGRTRGDFGGSFAGAEWDVFVAKISEPLVPEPSSLALCVATLLGLTATARKRRRSVCLVFHFRS